MKISEIDLFSACMRAMFQAIPRHCELCSVGEVVWAIVMPLDLVSCTSDCQCSSPSRTIEIVDIRKYAALSIKASGHDNFTHALRT
ncbi:hypothetical protein P73_3767 [Celeribacter indicus]|uniref:Uncharacterized protein n=1 Tax=Celeribacter indicus TaxID=1208324 RepID=A0A0B5E841_9RHOB|nr:hypothetical protein P73_3767 [Celeribacter indicus]